MKTKVFLFFVLLTCGGCYAQPANAQQSAPRFGMELNAGPAFSIRQWGEVKMKPGFGFEGTLHYRFYRNLGAYAGWGWNRFSAADSFAGKKSDFEETGYVLGLQFSRQIGRSPLSYHLRGGALWDHLEIESSGGEQLDDTGHDWGWQAAAGVSLAIGRQWSLGAGVKLNSLYRNDYRFFDGIRRDIDLKTLSLRVGINKMF